MSLVHLFQGYFRNSSSSAKKHPLRNTSQMSHSFFHHDQKKTLLRSGFKTSIIETMASILYQQPSKKRKNRVKSEHLLNFSNLKFPEHCKKKFSGAFGGNIRVFLEDFAEIQEYKVKDMHIWCTVLIDDQDEGVFPMYTVEEIIERDSVSPFCNHCVLSGWGHHYVCKRRYHFVVPAKERREMRLSSNFTEETKSHSLYGLIHCNGYGHLLCVKGLQSDSDSFSADVCMRFWNSFCTHLKTRYVSICNVTRKEAIELSLIHSALHGKTWFGKWGYKCSDSEECEKAISFLSSLGLNRIMSDSKNNHHGKRIKEVIQMYRILSVGCPLITIGDLLKFILEFKSGGDKFISDKCAWDIGNSEIGSASPMGLKRFLKYLTAVNSRWSSSRFEAVLSVIVDLLRNHRSEANKPSRGMSRQELRDEARKTIGDTGLIDFMLKCIKCVQVENQIICRVTNPSTKLSEYTICDSLRHEDGDGLGLNWPNNVIRFLYENVLLNYGETEVVLNMKRFVRTWPVDTSGYDGKPMKLICKVLPSFDELETVLTRSLSPGVVVVVEPWMTIDELKGVAQRALRDTYCVLDRFEVRQIGGLKAVEDDLVLYEVFEPGSEVWVRGCGIDFETTLRHEDGFRH